MEVRLRPSQSGNPTNVHTADITLRNILLQLKSIDAWTLSEIYSRFGHPRKETPRASPGSNPGSSAPRYVVQAAHPPPDHFPQPAAFLIDLGSSFPFATPPAPEEIGVPIMYRAPETVFDRKYTHHSDLWSLGCLLFELRAGTPMFSSFFGSMDDIVRQWVQTKGKLPEPWWGRWEARGEYYEENGDHVARPPGGMGMTRPYPLAEMIADVGSEDREAGSDEEGVVVQSSMLAPLGEAVPEAEAAELEDLLEKILRWKPEERLSCEEILKHPWFASV